ncbi:hypothetical protein AUEXF2481DRAFT_40113 [Aureobasidium subglaciale EXF-2481]|uniref:Uncharacterized protein n=1 Tax=Aureobasidium subglaciale (strain EXF-2481) TaxID=1043005 RepID=A0A074Z9T1_AURSE|nr:uncharacterized protein AUEXF2481DRAFT_40113 [Aureobasidium subglaciale EXF-2481]KAI5209262.1 hypothetical protein E4T38_02553 [Aureobasidium subglaciale]KAI5228174.1 hypothetical protein E4T40_02332 [Aureobasidium subglaciale]KAI5231416.1 hypothetical protein E4T41_02552 [Aureobasidium subglaciale]KAI5265502.1 hypothetical protein E4T46_02330 [Aureobasidium subglaciale]KEQ95546.1 hypothetical protein AUEXF2481DRAFT_40113 [Aureobasidium subglaciale EXF-2481]
MLRAAVNALAAVLTADDEQKREIDGAAFFSFLDTQVEEHDEVVSDELVADLLSDNFQALESWTKLSNGCKTT